MNRETHSEIIRFEPFAGYFEAAFFTDEGRDDKDLFDISEETATRTMQEIREMIAFSENLLEEYTESGAADEWDTHAIEEYLHSKDFGADFWFSRNGHGTGFFDAYLDNRALPKDYLDKLQCQTGEYPESALENIFNA